MEQVSRILSLLAGDPLADRTVPPSGQTARLTVFASAVMAFLAVFALAFALASGRVADRWGDELARTSTLRLTAPGDEMAAQVQTALTILQTTPGVASARALTGDEQKALLEPWFGPDLPVDTLPIPQLIEIVEDGGGFDAAGLRARIAGELPGAVLDDHTEWRRPLVRAAGALRSLGWLALALIAGVTGAVITLAASASLAANAQVIRVLRLVGAKDTYIARAFVRRFTLRAVLGALIGTVAAMVVLAFLPAADTAGGFLTGLGFAGAGWVTPLLIPPLAGMVGFVATRAAALRMLKGMS